MIWQINHLKNALPSWLGRFWLIGISLLTACQTLPPTPHLPKSTELSTRTLHARPTPTTHQNRTSGYYPLASGADAWTARHVLTTTAKHTIDVQYYIWHDDEAGLLMLHDLWQSAERGVLVRLLIDDFNSSPSLDKHLSRFAQHPNIAVRMVNPLTYRRHKFVNFLTSPRRVNVRMHNKSMTFDNQISIIGGRNIGNEYLNNHPNNHFADLDVLLTGAVVDDISRSFDDYWHSPASYDIETLVKSDNTPFTAQHTPATPAMTSNTLGQNLLDGQVPFMWADIKFLSDGVAKLGKKQQHHKGDYLVSQLRHELARPTKQFSIISSYFAPTKEGVKTLTELAKRGVKISILTNAFHATDVRSVHAGYGHWRRELLMAGIKLYEFKADAKNPNDTPPTTFSLHAKAFAVDDDKVFIGSYNIDPRSANINTELGVLIYDKTLAHHLHHALNNDNGDNTQILNQAYEVRLVDGNLVWQTLENGKLITLDQEPNMNIIERIGIDVMSVLPIEGWL